MATPAELVAATRAVDDGRMAETSPWRWIGTLFLAEGIPSAVVTVLSTLVLKRLGVGNADVAFYSSALILPWIVRPLWSPLLEAVRTYRFFVVAMQAVTAAAFAGVAASLAAGRPAGLCVALLALVAVSSATHDMAADGLFITSLSASQQERYVGWLSVAFNAGKFGVQGLLVVLAGLLETRGHVLEAWRIVFVVLAAATAALALYHAYYLPEGRRSTAPRAARGTSLAVLRTFFDKPVIVWLLVLVVSYRITEGQLVRVVPLLLLDPESAGGFGLSTAQYGWLYGGLAAAAFMVGAVLGGWASARVGLHRAVLGLCAAFNVPALLYLWLALVRPRSLAVIAAVIVTEQVAYGIGSVGLKLVMMRALAPGPYPTAHFALAAGLTALSATGAGMISGHVQSWLGYGGFFGWAVLAAAPALLAASVCARKGAFAPA